MPKIDLSITISVIVALAAIISPIFVTIINNIHHTKTRRLELEQELSVKKLTILYEDKKHAFSNFLLNAGKVCTNEETHDVEQDFYAYTQLALLFASAENRRRISQFASEIVQYLDVGIPPDKYAYFLKLVSDIADTLNQELTVLNLEICHNKNCKQIQNHY